MAGDQHVLARPPPPPPATPWYPATRWSTSTPSRRCGPGPNAATAAARSSMPCIGSTTTPSTRRSCPHTRSTSSASCRPSTQIRAARAVRAGVSDDLHRPGRRTRRRGRRGGAGGPAWSARPRPGTRPARSGNTRRRPCRSSRVTSRLSAATTAPQNPLAGSSTTSPASAGSSGTERRTRCGGRRRRRSPGSPGWAPAQFVPGRPSRSRRDRHAGRRGRGADLRRGPVTGFTHTAGVP